MVKKASDIEKEALLLSPRERARLARRLVESLDVAEDLNAEQSWLDEAERRLADYRAGVTEARPAFDVFADVERRLK